MQAHFENGVLGVTLPKSQPQERSRRIQVQGAQRGGEGGGQAQPSDAGQSAPAQQGNGSQSSSGQGAAR